MYGYLMAFVSISSPLLALRYEQAIMLSRSKSELMAIVKLSFILTVLITFVISTLALAVDLFLSDGVYKHYIYICFFVLLLTGLYNIGIAILNYHREFHAISKNIVLTSATNTTGNIIIGLCHQVTLSMIVSLLISKVVSLCIIGSKLKLYIINRVKNKYINVISKKYSDFPKYSAPEVLLGGISTHINFLFIGFFSQGIAGAYYLVNRLAGIPVGIFSSSYSKVFFKDFSVEENKRDFLRKCWIRLTVFSFLPFLILYLSSPYVFVLVLGNEWSLCSDISLVLIPFFWINFILGSTSTSHIVLRIQHISLIFSIINVCIKSFIYFYSIWFNLEFLDTLRYITISDISAVILMNVIAYAKS